jgi:hypothetical protein
MIYPIVSTTVVLLSVLFAIILKNETKENHRKRIQLDKMEEDMWLKLNQDKKNQQTLIKELYDQGYTSREISKKLNVRQGIVEVTLNLMVKGGA